MIELPGSLVGAEAWPPWVPVERADLVATDAEYRGRYEQVLAQLRRLLGLS